MTTSHTKDQVYKEDGGKKNNNKKEDIDYMCWCQTEWKPIRKNSFARCSSLWVFIFSDKYLHHLLHSTFHSFYSSFDSSGPDLSWRSSLQRKMQLLKEVESISWRTVKIRKRPWTGDQNSMGRKSEETVRCVHNWPELSSRQSAASLISWNSFQGIWFHSKYTELKQSSLEVRAVNV